MESDRADTGTNKGRPESRPSLEKQDRRAYAALARALAIVARLQPVAA
jgi:hypothetical protein